MTAIPPHGDVSKLTIVCDGCGDSVAVAKPTPDYRAAWLLLWQQSMYAGWKGNARPIGPHYCAVCEE
nr:hypothetical protein [Kibdelosporangium sp. MJ126-NF4]